MHKRAQKIARRKKNFVKNLSQFFSLCAYVQQEEKFSYFFNQIKPKNNDTLHKVNVKKSYSNEFEG